EASRMYCARHGAQSRSIFFTPLHPRATDHVPKTDPTPGRRGEPVRPVVFRDRSIIPRPTPLVATPLDFPGESRRDRRHTRREPPRFSLRTIAATRLSDGRATP